MGMEVYVMARVGWAWKCTPWRGSEWFGRGYLLVIGFGRSRPGAARSGLVWRGRVCRGGGRHGMEKVRPDLGSVIYLSTPQLEAWYWNAWFRTWKTFHPELSGIVTVCSVPEQDQLLFSLACAQCDIAWAARRKPQVYRLQPGDTLTLVFKSTDTRHPCEHTKVWSDYRQPPGFGDILRLELLTDQ